jgi:hypothetical protein
MLTRRESLRLLAATLGSACVGRLSAQEEELPPIRQLTRGPKFHWFGYYDKWQFDPTGRYILGNQVDFEHRSPRKEDQIRVGMVDTHDGDKWQELGTTRAWNWQQGCMLQWLPGKQEVLWNDRGEDNFVCHLLNLKTNAQRTLPVPIYCVAPDGTWGLTCDFRRLNDCRPGYGYAGLPDPNAEELAPDDAGIWRVDFATGKQTLLFSFAAAARLPYEPGFSLGAKHWFNHLLIAPDGKRFIFLHRWRGQKEGKGFSTRMFTANADGTDLYVLDPHGKTSHFIWRDQEHVLAWAWHPSAGEKFYLYQDRSQQVEVVGKEVMTVNGHCTYLPGNAWILNDTYPDKERLQHPYVYRLADGRRFPLGHFRSPAEYQGEWRCDTHPRFNPAGTQVCIDSPHNGGRQMYLIELAGLVGKR